MSDEIGWCKAHCAKLESIFCIMPLCWGRFGIFFPLIWLGIERVEEMDINETIIINCLNPEEKVKYLSSSGYFTLLNIAADSHSILQRNTSKYKHTHTHTHTCLHTCIHMHSDIVHNILVEKRVLQQSFSFEMRTYIGQDNIDTCVCMPTVCMLKLHIYNYQLNCFWKCTVQYSRLWWDEIKMNK